MVIERQPKNPRAELSRQPVYLDLGKVSPNAYPPANDHLVPDDSVEILRGKDRSGEWLRRLQKRQIVYAASI